RRSKPEQASRYRVLRRAPQPAGPFDTIAGALAQWRADQQPLQQTPQQTQGPEPLRAAVIEIEDSEVYSEPLAIALQAGESLQIRGASRHRPIIRLLDYMTSRADAFTISGQAGSRFALVGVIVTGRGLQINGPDRDDPSSAGKGDLCDVTISHCTLVPGWALDCDCEPTRPNEPSIEITARPGRLAIDPSILGSIVVSADEVLTDPVDIAITDSIVDATSPDRVAIGAPNLPLAFASLSIARCTVFGEVQVHAIALAENAIFTSPVRAARRQIGCVRFCHVPAGSRTPRRYHCQPDLVFAAIETATPPIPPADRPALDARDAARVFPRFTSMRYGTPAYAQLARDVAREIARGADDEAEMGAFHDLFQPQREASLRTRLAEFTPAGSEAGLFF